MTLFLLLLWCVNEPGMLVVEHTAQNIVLDGKVDPETTVYVARIDYATSQSSKNPRSAKSGSDYVLIDPSGSQIRYLCEKPAAKKKLTFNPTFDIWSVMDSPDDQSKWITNWQSN